MKFDLLDGGEGSEYNGIDLVGISDIVSMLGTSFVGNCAI